MATWRMAFRAGKNGPAMWPECYRLGIAAIEYGPVDDVDLSKYVEGEPAAAWAKLHPSQKASLRRFVYEMREGDVIYVKEGPIILGKGVVIGPYRFDKNGRIQEPNGVYWQHQRAVEWSPSFPNVRIQIGKSQQFVVESVTAEDVARVELAAMASWPNANDADEGEANDASSYFGQDGDHRDTAWQEIKKRRGQSEFRNALRLRYGDHCLVTRCKLVDVLEAAHIDPYRGLEQHHPENGLLLRSDVHTLFDLDLLGVEPDTLLIQLNPGINVEYRDIVGKKLACPENRRPSIDALRRRYEQFQMRKDQLG